MLGQRAELPGNADPRRLIAAGKIFTTRTALDMVAPGQLGVDGEEDAAVHPHPLAAGGKISVNRARHHARDAGSLFEILARRRSEERRVRKERGSTWRFRCSTSK